MAKIKVSADFDLPLIAENAGNGKFEDRRYYKGELHVKNVTQKALNDALAAYAHVEPIKPLSDFEALKQTLITKGIITEQEFKDKKDKK